MKLKQEIVTLLQQNYEVRKEISERSQCDITSIDRWLLANVNNGRLTGYDILKTIAERLNIDNIGDLITDEQPRKTETRL